MSGMLGDSKILREPAEMEQVVPIMARLLQRAWLALDSDAHAARQEIQNALKLLSGVAISIEVVASHLRCAHHGLAPRQARCVFEYINANLDTSIPVEDMASICRFSRDVEQCARYRLRGDWCLRRHDAADWRQHLAEHPPQHEHAGDLRELF